MPRDTELAYSLRESLGSESAGRWLQVMDLIRASLPFLLQKAGRPSNEEVSSSAIGRAGFTSWRDMIEAAPEQGGLGWSYDSYKSWKKAYALVLKHPYLRDLSLSASEINTISRENPEFPSSLEEFQGLREKRKDAQEERRLNSVKALQSQLSTANREKSALQADLDTSRASEAALKSIESQLRQELAQSSEKIGALQVQVRTANEKLEEMESLKASLESAQRANQAMSGYIRRRQNMSRWELFMAFWKGALPTSQDVDAALQQKKKRKIKIGKG